MTTPATPAPVPAPAAAPTQVQHPHRAVVRTVLAGLVGLLPLIPEALTSTHLDATAVGAQMITVAAAVTRLLALPGVESWLRRTGLLRWLAAEPRA